jgi:hypothetical protein
VSSVLASVHSFLKSCLVHFITFLVVKRDTERDIILFCFFYLRVLSFCSCDAGVMEELIKEHLGISVR